MSLSSSQARSSGANRLTLLWGESQGTEVILQCLDLLQQLLTLVRESLDIHCSQRALKKTDTIKRNWPFKLLKDNFRFKWLSMLKF